MSGELSPDGTLTQLFPPSRLRQVLSISTPTQAVFASPGSAVSVVTRVCMIRGHCFSKSPPTSCHDRPPSPVRNSLAGHAPTSITSGRPGQGRTDQTCRPFRGELTCSQELAPLTLRKRP